MWSRGKKTGAYLQQNGTCLFRVWAPKAGSVEAVVNGKAYPMQKDQDGYWEAEVAGVKAGSRYKFCLDDENELPDPASVSQPDGVHEASEVVSREYDWSENGWEGLPLHEMVQYELHTGTFTREGTFAGIEEKLDYLLELGVNTIEIMPVTAFPGNRNWGYDGVYPYAVQHSYGGPESFKHLINTCHQKGMAVILDVVYNHLGPEGNYLGQYGPYFTDKYNTPWGSAINFDDAYCDHVRSYFINNALMWFEEYHVDALRLDAVHAIKDTGAFHIMAEMAEAVKALSQEKGREMVLIAESDLNDSRYIKPLAQNGYGMTGQWIDEFHHALHAHLTGERAGYYTDFGSAEQIKKAFKDTYVYDGKYSPGRKKTFGNSAKGHPFNQFVVFSQNHDQVGNRMLGERLTELLSFEALKMVAASVILSPYVPMLFMGEEYGETNRFQYFVSHTDPDLVEAVRKGRKEEFKEFHAKGDAPDPQSEETFNRSKLSWKIEGKKEREVMLKFYKELIRLRKAHKAITNPERESLKASLENGLLLVTRTSGEEELLLVLNFEKQEKKFTNTDSSFVRMTNRKLLDSADKKWLGPGSKEGVIMPESVVLFQLTIDS